MLAVGGILYALGLIVMSSAHSALALDMGAGVLIGVGLSASSFGVVMGVVARSAERYEKWVSG